MGHLLNFATWHVEYAMETRQRMEHTVGEFRDVTQQDTGSIDRTLVWLTEQQAACRQAGFGNVLSLCDKMVDLLAEIHSGERPWSPAIAVTLLEACKRIRQHADTVARRAVWHEAEGLPRPRHRKLAGKVASGGDAKINQEKRQSAAG